MNDDDSGMRLPRYVQQRPWGSFRYKRNVPKHLLKKLGKTHVYKNLGDSYTDMITALPKAHAEVEALFRASESETTRDRTLAVVESHFGKEAAEMLAAGQIDENLEMGLWDLHQQLEGDVDIGVLRNLYSAQVADDVISLERAFTLYADFKETSKNKKLADSLVKVQADLKASIGVVKLAKLSMTTLRRDDALRYRDHLLDRVSPNSVTRYINIVRAVVNFTIDERGLTMVNPFHNLKVKGAGNKATDRLSLTPQEAVDGFDTLGGRSDLRAIYVALWDTGARLAEITGLQVRDIDQKDRSVHIRHNGIRGLKTASSDRVLPLSLRVFEGLQEHLRGKDETAPIFARYGREGGNTAASALLMKHFRKAITDPKKSLHSLRHKKKDDLRV